MGASRPWGGVNLNISVLVGLFQRLSTRLQKNRYGLAAFLIPMGVRAIPEILVGPYPVGWDTIAYYVPNTLDWAAGRSGWLELLGNAPLMYMLSVVVYLVSTVNPVWIFKVMGPVFYAGMIFALFRFLRRGLRWNNRLSLGGALLTSFYFVTLRMSWDLYRNMLGLTFILLALPLLEDWKEPRKQLLLSGLIVLAVATNQVTGVIALFLVGVRVLGGLLDRRRDVFLGLIRVSIPGVAMFLSIAYAGLVVSRGSLVREQPPVPTLEGFGSSVGFLGYAYLPLAPLIVLGSGRVGNFDLRNWSLFCAGAALTDLLPFFGSIVVSYRWSLLLTVPLCVYAAAGLRRIAVPMSITGWRGRLQGRILPLFSAALVLSAALYVALPAQQAMVYYTAFPGLLPTSMVQGTVPLSEMEDLRRLLDWVAVNVGPETALITHEAIYGWARAYLPSADHIVNYGFFDPLEGVALAKSAGYSSILMIWWVNGLGWHGQPTVPSGFVPIVQDGNLAVYRYS